MKFIPEELTEEEERQRYYLRRWRSENNKWELFYIQRMFGITVGFGPYKGRCLCRTYCCEMDESAMLEVFLYLAMTLERFDEDIKITELESYFPIEQVKPIRNNPNLLEFLRQLAFEEIPLKRYPKIEQIGLRELEWKNAQSNVKNEDAVVVQ